MFKCVNKNMNNEKGNKQNNKTKGKQHMKKHTKNTVRHNSWESQAEGARKANSHPQTRQHRSRIAASIREHHEKFHGRMIKAVEIETGNTEYFISASDAARSLGCSKQLVARVATQNSKNKSAKGWELTWIKVQDVINNTAV